MKQHSLDPILVASLISKFLLDELTRDEKEQLEIWLQDSEENRRFFETCKDEDTLQKNLNFFDATDMDTGWGNIKQKIQQSTIHDQKSSHSITAWIHRYKKISIAAVLVIVGIAFLWTFQPKSDPGIVTDLTGRYKNDILPGKDQAQLVLSSGITVNLQAQDDNKFTEQDGTLIKSNSGKINYANHTADNQGQKDELYNILRVPKGGTFQIALPDGTQVWLNSESELRFPVHFSGSTRNVFLKGEAFFEVVKNTHRPFLVQVNESIVEVLGTQFNVNAYNGIVKTTLQEGSVKLLTPDGSSAVLKPGEFGNIQDNSIQIDEANLRKEFAWKNGEFYFKKDRFSDILNQLSSWYDLSIKIDEQMANMSITGSINKDVRLSEVLKMLTYVTQGNFELNGRQLTITSKPANNHSN